MLAWYSIFCIKSSLFKAQIEPTHNAKPYEAECPSPGLRIHINEEKQSVPSRQINCIQASRVKSESGPCKCVLCDFSGPGPGGRAHRSSISYGLQIPHAKEPAYKQESPLECKKRREQQISVAMTICNLREVVGSKSFINKFPQGKEVFPPAVLRETAPTTYITVSIPVAKRGTWVSAEMHLLDAPSMMKAYHHLLWVQLADSTQWSVPLHMALAEENHIAKSRSPFSERSICNDYLTKEKVVLLHN